MKSIIELCMLIKVILPPRIRSVNMSGVTFSLLLFAAFISMPNGSNGDYKMEMYNGGNYKVMWKYDMIKD